MLITKKEFAALQKNYGLTARELEVVKLLFNGVDSNKDIAERMGITVGTARNYAHTIFIKLKVESKLQAVVKLSIEAKKLTEK